MAKTIIDELVVKLGFQLTGKDLPEKVKKDTDKVDSVEKKSATTTEQVEKRKTAATKKGARDRREQRERDTKERKKDIARETDEAKEYEDREKNKTSSMAAMIAKRFALAYAAKKTFDAVKNIGGDDAALVRLTESMNNKPEEVKAFANALQILTGDGQDAIQTLVSLQREIDNFNINHTNPEIAQNLGRLGIHMQGENGKSKSSVEIVSELRDVIKRSQFSKSEIYTLLQPLGISTDMYALLRSPDYEERIAQGRKNATNVTGSGQTFQKGIDFWGGTVNKIEDYIRQGIGGAGGLVDQAGNEAKKNGVDSAFFKGLIMQESGFNPSAKSSAGATGIGQMMGPAMDEVGGGGLAGSAKYFSKMLKKYGDYDTAAKAYNWGPGNMDSFLKNGVGIHGQPMPKETIDYVPSIMKNAEQFRRQEQSNSTSVQVDNININTQATDAKGIARDIRSAITMQSENGQR